MGSAFLCTVHQRGEFRRNPKNPIQDLLDQKEKRLLGKNDGPPTKVLLLLLLHFVVRILENQTFDHVFYARIKLIHMHTYLHMKSVRLFQCSMILIRTQPTPKYVNITQRNKYVGK